MKSKQTRTYTPEQRQAMADRMRQAQTKRWEDKRQTHQSPFGDNPAQAPDPVDSRRQSAPQAIVEGSSAVAIQKKDVVVVEAEKVEAELLITQKVYADGPGLLTTLPPPRIGSREVRIIVRTDGTMVSQYGPCICGAGKNQWHKICLKET